MCKYSLKTIRNKAYKVNHKVSKGFQHYFNGGVCKDCNGIPYTGYNVENLNTGILASACYNEGCDHLMTLEDVEEFLKNVYEKNGLKY